MKRSKEAGKPFYTYLPYTQVHIPPIPDPEFAAKTKRGNWADVLTQIDAFTGRILDALDDLGLADDTIVVWTLTTARSSSYRMPAADPDPLGGSGMDSRARGGAGTSPRLRARTARRASSAGQARCRPARSATSSSTSSTCSTRW